jgi:hypothetical protein
VSRITAGRYAETVRRYVGHRVDALRLVASVEGKHGSGVILTEDARQHPGILGVAAIDSLGESGHLALDRAEVTALRDALTAWLETPTPPEPGTCGHVGPRGRPCTDPAGHAGDDLTGESHGDGSVFRWLVRPPDRFPETDVTVPPPL